MKIPPATKNLLKKISAKIPRPTKPKSRAITKQNGKLLTYRVRHNCYRSTMLFYMSTIGSLRLTSLVVELRQDSTDMEMQIRGKAAVFVTNLKASARKFITTAEYCKVLYQIRQHQLCVPPR